jgi:DNA polymerase-3 subunit delta
MICDRVAGNLLAAVQEIDKLELLADNKHIDAALVTESVSDNARYNLFSTVDIALAGRGRDTIKMMRGLQAEGTEPTVVIWAVHRELNLLYRCREQLDRGEHLNQVLNSHRVWPSRHSVVGAGLKRLSCADLEQLFAVAVAADQTIKGMRQGDPWEKLTDLMLGLAGVSVLTAEAMTS